MDARRRRIDSLLLSRATEGLSRTEEHELERLLALVPGVDTDVYERGAAAVCLAVFGRRTQLPRGLRERLTAQVDEIAKGDEA